jgi:hypothetical protein
MALIDVHYTSTLVQTVGDHPRKFSELLTCNIINISQQLENGPEFSPKPIAFP